LFDVTKRNIFTKVPDSIKDEWKL